MPRIDDEPSNNGRHKIESHVRSEICRLSKCFEDADKLSKSAEEYDARKQAEDVRQRAQAEFWVAAMELARSEERRVGKECRL